MEALHIHYSVQETECCKVSRDLWVIAQRELTSDYGGGDRSLLRFLLLLSTRFLFVSSAAPSICSETTPRTRDCITAAVWSDGRWWVCLRGCRQGWQTARVSCVTAALDHGQPCLVGERVFPVLRPSWDRSGIYEESEVRNAAGGGGGGGGGGAQRLADLQITHGKKQIGLIWEHARTCAPGKGTPALLLQTESVNTVTQHY